MTLAEIREEIETIRTRILSRGGDPIIGKESQADWDRLRQLRMIERLHIFIEAEL